MNIYKCYCYYIGTTTNLQASSFVVSRNRLFLEIQIYICTHCHLWMACRSIGKDDIPAVSVVACQLQYSLLPLQSSYDDSLRNEHGVANLLEEVIVDSINLLFNLQPGVMTASGTLCLCSVSCTPCGTRGPCCGICRRDLGTCEQCTQDSSTPHSRSSELKPWESCAHVLCSSR